MGTWRCSRYSDPARCVMKLDWGQEGWTGPIVCWGEGGIGVKKVWVTGRKLTIVNGEEGRPKPSTGHLGWIKSGSLRGLGDCRGERSRFPVRTFFVKVRLDGFSRTHDAGYFDPVPTRYPSAAQNLFMPLFVCREEFVCSLLWLSFENIWFPKHIVTDMMWGAKNIWYITNVETMMSPSRYNVPDSNRQNRL